MQRVMQIGMRHIAPGPAPPSPMTIKRINREINDLKKEDLGDIRLAPSEASMLEWTGAIPGPKGSVYEGGLFEFSLTLPSDYPFAAPKITFKTRIYHMNISQTGHICLDILKNAWSPALSIFKVILSLSSLLTDPNPSDPLVPPIATEYTRKRAQHDQTARLWTQLYAITPPKGKYHPTIDLTASTRPHLPGIPASEPARTVSSISTTTFSRPRPVPLAVVSSQTIDLSDDEADATAVTSASGTIILPGSKRKRNSGDAPNPSPRSRRRRAADRSEEGFATTGASGSLPDAVPSTRRRAREVIVIDDD